MTVSALRILISSRPQAYDAILASFATLRTEVQQADTADDALSYIEEFKPDVIILHPNEHGDLQRLVLGAQKPIIVVAEEPTPHGAVQAVREGAFSYVPVGTRLLDALRELVERHKPEMLRPRWDSNERNILNRIVSRTQVMQSVVERVRSVARTPNTTALVLGETGVGKELIASAIHSLSARAQAPFIAVDCSSIPETLIESELFGHERGAFSGAVSERRGRIELANGGTLFLDEIGELPLAMQTRLLRVLEEREVWRVGASKPTKVDLRVVAATHRDLGIMVKQERFRADLFYRLSVFELRIPALRERTADIIHLAEHFLDQVCREQGRERLRLTSAASAKLVAYAFPGNVRELRNVIEQAVVSTDGPTIDATALRTQSEFSVAPQAPTDTPAPGASTPLTITWGENALDNLERDVIRRALAATQGNQTRAAKLLGIQRLVLVRAMARHGLEGSSQRGRPRKTELS